MDPDELPSTFGRFLVAGPAPYGLALQALHFDSGYWIERDSDDPIAPLELMVRERLYGGRLGGVHRGTAQVLPAEGGYRLGWALFDRLASALTTPPGVLQARGLAPQGPLDVKDAAALLGVSVRTLQETVRLSPPPLAFRGSRRVTGKWADEADLHRWWTDAQAGRRPPLKASRVRGRTKGAKGL